MTSRHVQNESGAGSTPSTAPLSPVWGDDTAPVPTWTVPRRARWNAYEQHGGRDGGGQDSRVVSRAGRQNRRITQHPRDAVTQDMGEFDDGGERFPGDADGHSVTLGLFGGGALDPGDDLGQGLLIGSAGIEPAA